MISFESDYINGAHPLVLQHLIDTNQESLSGYGSDVHTRRAKERIREALGCPGADIEFLTGGTQTNATLISSLLSDWEGVVCAGSGHIAVHEAGAVEYTGHKVLTLPQTKGKISAADLTLFLHDFYADQNHEHMVFPGMVYLSQPTEYGTIYSKNDLSEISRICRAHQIPLYIDGARLGYALMSPENDVLLSDLCELADVFYIGGTKIGALCGEALVFPQGNKPAHFSTSIKKRGALLAKGRLIGVQFEALFTDDLYFSISAHAIQMAKELKQIFHEKNIPFFLESPTNQQFVILENHQMELLQEKIAFSFWESYDDSHTVVRFATSWSTTSQDLKSLKDALS